MNKLHACCMTQNELYDLSRNLQWIRRHVDTITVVDGGSTDGTIPYLRNWSRQDPGVRLFIHPWLDNFPAQRNNYLRRVGEIAQDGDWLVVFDPDEYIMAPERLREAAELAVVNRNHHRVGFRCRSVSLRGEDRVWQSEDQFWKNLLVRWSPHLSYSHHGEGPVHEDLQGSGGIIMSGCEPWMPELIYEHRKQEDVIWQRGVRNYFCGGGGPNLGSRNHRWVELKAICARIGIGRWADMLAYLLRGNIDQELKDWILRYRHEQGWDGSSEQREWRLFYFRMLHPEEEPPEFRHE